MFGPSQSRSFEDIFNFQRDVDRLLNQFWADAPVRSCPTNHGFPFRVHTAEDGWRIDVPMPGIDPSTVTLEVTGQTIVVRAEQDGGRHDGAAQWEQTMTVPRMLDVDGIRATHRHGLLVLTIPLKESIKPRRVPIDGVAADASTQLTTA